MLRALSRRLIRDDRGRRWPPRSSDRRRREEGPFEPGRVTQMSDISENAESLLTIISAAEQPGFVTTSDPPKENAIDRRQLFRAAAPWVGGVFGIAALGLEVPRSMAQVVASAELGAPGLSLSWSRSGAGSRPPPGSMSGAGPFQRSNSRKVSSGVAADPVQ